MDGHTSDRLHAARLSQLPGGERVSFSKGIPFTDRDIRQDPAARDELVRLGYRATPVTLVDRQVVVGFDSGRLEPPLGLA